VVVDRTRGNCEYFCGSLDVVVAGPDVVVVVGTLDLAGSATLGTGAERTVVDVDTDVDVEVDVVVPDRVLWPGGRTLDSLVTALRTLPARDLIPSTPATRPRTVTKTLKAAKMGWKYFVRGPVSSVVRRAELFRRAANRRALAVATCRPLWGRDTYNTNRRDFACFPRRHIIIKNRGTCGTTYRRRLEFVQWSAGKRWAVGAVSL
jgi:hypothetical protein